MTPLVSGLVTLSSMFFNGAASGSNGKTAASARKPAESTDAGPAAVLTLSKDAEVIARFADQGISVASRTLEGQLTRTRVAGGTGHTPAADARDALVSTDDFQKLLAQFGATDEQKAALTAGFDADKDGAVSQNEFLKGLAATKGERSGSDTSQMLMRLMDGQGNANGEISAKEFAQFTTAFADLQAQARRPA
ncbi:MAG: hypothetical protein EOO33_02785 [Comamonadaceae bacterium]|nr:MAG: hypothetical protein EOO33_02785 [Comamonadaceae bacterium]